MAAIFTYEFQKAADGFAAAGCELHTLSNYSTLISAAVESGYINRQDIETLKQWRMDPSSWGLNQ
jgi:orotate phosphoribosyltransferase